MKNPNEFLNQRDTSAGKITHRLSLFIELYKKFRKNNSRILDIECGQNAVLSKYIEKEDEYYACDYYKKIKNQKVKKYFQIDLNNQELNKIVPHKFDVVFCGEVIEHLFSPDHLMNEVKKILNKDGILILSTPNLAYLPNRIMLLVGMHPFFLENSSDYKLGRVFKNLGQMNTTEGHIKVFTYGALKELFELTGYKIFDERATVVFNEKFDLLVGNIHHSFGPDTVFALRPKV
ncbi:hypothetical protein COV49_01195 [Candidatus Falkowbacteria bacterium CG11_big_fil_rev_8_21_14_0_20_39_10]|uniref:Methyltransferase type 11 domain-containing protein n=1 Tax=Candidatus Falkowbacteria bacterium CG11_big_fil_rev_8_21_14_0_20_39_10 TaxID=1974570 RepID=A0A2M6K9L9_9BACT|nr:MAG: hypothetical protein COV49_01195 [Candidatus Falkowbacteria bacterium CG11_big_fil_rev_8_21_14_0_20_39_10]